MDYAALSNRVHDIIMSFGQSVTVRRRIMSGPNYDREPSSYISFITTAVDDAIRHFDTTSRNLVTQRRLWVSAKGGEIKKGDFITVGERMHRVYESRPVSPGGTILVYEVVLEA